MMSSDKYRTIVVMKIEEPGLGRYESFAAYWMDESAKRCYGLTEEIAIRQLISTYPPKSERKRTLGIEFSVLDSDPELEMIIRRSLMNREVLDVFIGTTHITGNIVLSGGYQSKHGGHLTVSLGDVTVLEHGRQATQE